MQELLEKLEFIKGEFKKRQDQSTIGSIEYYHYLGIIQGYEFSIDEIKKAML